MKERLLSVGIDIGTATTQLILSRLTLENRAAPFTVPRVAISQREVFFRSGIHRTPLRSETVIDAQGVRDIVAGEYASAGLRREEVDTGAVIITGETARKENAREVLAALSQFAGDFVVATAGPDLESMLAARGAGIDEYAKEKQKKILHCDIGGGTANLTFYDCGQLVATGCLDVGGRLIRLDGDRVAYVAPVLRELPGVPRVGDRVGPEELRPAVEAMVEALAQAAGLAPVTDRLNHFITERTRWVPQPAEEFSFSGGVADCIYEPQERWDAFGDVGVLLGQAVRARFPAERLHRGTETIRATVVGAGSHSTELSGSTIYHRQVDFPLKNLPVLKLTAEEEQGDAAGLAEAIRAKLRWFADQEGLSQVVLALRGTPDPSYGRVQQVAEGVCRGLEPLCAAGFFPVVAVERDMAKVLGQAMGSRSAGPLLCLDGVAMDTGDYLDVGAPVAAGTVLPVVIKTLVFNAAERQKGENR